MHPIYNESLGEENRRILQKNIANAITSWNLPIDMPNESRSQQHWQEEMAVDKKFRGM